MSAYLKNEFIDKFLSEKGILFDQQKCENEGQIVEDKGLGLGIYEL